jgi:hypothetical protein
VDIGTIAELGTAVGTLFLGVATFSATRSANRSARIAERALLVGMRPVLAEARPEDAPQDVIFGDGRTVHVRGGQAAVDAIDGSVYLAVPLRNVGAGLAVLQGYDILTENPIEASGYRLAHGLHERSSRSFGPVESFRDQQRDIYIAAGGTGYWQAAFREPDDELRRALAESIAAPRPFSADLLYGDHEGGQHAVTRMNLVPGEDGRWYCTSVFHWSLDGIDPRDV